MFSLDYSVSTKTEPKFKNRDTSHSLYDKNQLELASDHLTPRVPQFPTFPPISLRTRLSISEIVEKNRDYSRPPIPGAEPLKLLQFPN